MLLYALASALLGCTGIPCLAQGSLDMRGLSTMLSRTQRIGIVLICACGALAAWALVDELVSCLAFTFACACMSALLICDLREHVLPTELVLLMLLFGATFRLVTGGVHEVVCVGVPAALIAATLLLLNTLRARRGACELVGSGDVRMIVPLALFSGTAGLMPGVLSCSLLMGLVALAQLALGKVKRHSGIALAPGLAAWLFAGTLLPLA